MLKKMLKMAAITVPQVLMPYGSPGFNGFIEKLLKGLGHKDRVRR